MRNMMSVNGGSNAGRRKAQAEKQHEATLQTLAKNPATDDAALFEQAIRDRGKPVLKFKKR